MALSIAASPAPATAASSAQGSATPSPKLVAAAHEFEAQMMKELLKPLSSSDGLGGDLGADDDGEGSGNALKEFATESLGRAVSQHGGLGISQKIVSLLTKNQGNNPGSTGVTSEGYRNTVMRTLQ